MKPQHARPGPQWDLVQECFSEAAFLWAQWEDMLDSPQHTLGGVVRAVERRLIGALDGAALGGTRAVREIFVPALLGRRARPATAAAYLLAAGDRAAAEHLVDALVAAPAGRLPALRRGIECSIAAEWPGVLSSALPRLRADAQATVLEALAFRRFPLPAGLDRYLDRRAPLVQRSGLRLSATMQEPWTTAYIDWGLGQTDPVLQVEAARAGTLRGRAEALGRAHELVERRWPGSDVLLPLCAFASGNRMLPVLRDRVQVPECGRDAFDALACVGTVEAAEVCASQLDRPDVARLSADALRAITGLDPTPAGPPPAEDPPAHQQLLPMPDPEALRGRWQQLRRHYDPRTRYLDGRPLSPGLLARALAEATMRRRRLLARELTVRTQGASHVTTGTWSAVQRGQLRQILATEGQPVKRRADAAA